MNVTWTEIHEQGGKKIIKSANVQYGSICFLVPVIKCTTSLDPAQSQDLQLLLRTFFKGRTIRGF